MVNVICPNCSMNFNVPFYKTKDYKRNFCSKNCHDECRRKEKYEEMNKLVGEDFETWLRRKYVADVKTTREIAAEVYGNNKMQSSINRWLVRFDIPLRRGSDAIKIQWIDNVERREQASKTAKETLLKNEVREKVKNTQKTEQSKKKSSDAKLGDKNSMYGVIGEKHPKWNPEKTNEQRVAERNTNEVYQWRKAIFERDGFTCQHCEDNKGGNLVAHHIDSYDWCIDKRTDIENGVTLCETCHKKFHSKYGYGSNTIEQFKEFGRTKTEVAK